MNYKKYYEEHKSELLKIIYDLGYNPHTLIEDAQKENMSYKEYIITLCI